MAFEDRYVIRREIKCARNLDRKLTKAIFLNDHILNEIKRFREYR